VPEFYLRRFADGGLVVMTDKREDRKAQVPVDVVMVIKDFYTIETDKGRSYVVEKWLADLEGRAAEVLRKIDARRCDRTCSRASVPQRGDQRSSPMQGASPRRR
jgi:hypothetical protein